MLLNGLNAMLRYGGYSLLTFAGLVSTQSTGVEVDLGWYPPKQTYINNLTAIIETQGIYGWIFNSSDTPDDIYGTYNWCNMPHVREREYPIPPKEYELVYVEVIHRHHKRTPYSSNGFPIEPQPWDCSDIGLFHHSQPLPNTSSPSSSSSQASLSATPAYWRFITSPLNPFPPPSGLTGTCQFPQITLSGLNDSYVHGLDLYSVYHSLITSSSSSSSSSQLSSIEIRVTTNPITSQVAGALVAGLLAALPSHHPATLMPLLVQPSALDSLEPKYPCPSSSALFRDLQSPSKNPRWESHLSLMLDDLLRTSFDPVSGVPPTDPEFHKSTDHYYDNLSAKQCHRGFPLPCSVTDKKNCLTQADVDAVYRLGQWEYDHVFRSGGPETLKASLGSQGVWIAELARHLRNAIDDGDGDSGGEQKIKYRHNVAHDGSMSRVLSILQVDEMVWPGMGSEVVFELYRGRGAQKEKGKQLYYVRVLWGGQVLRSSNPSLGMMDMLPVEILLAYFDGLVGRNAEKVRELCGL